VILRRRFHLASLLSVVLAGAACGSVADRRGGTVLFASGADLQSINPLLTVHPLARQVQRYVLFMTLAQYDSALTPRPYLARDWSWSADRKALTFRLRRDVAWHDGTPTTARDVVWTLRMALDTATGYPRLTELADVQQVEVAADTLVVVRFRAPVAAFPDVLTDLAILPAHLLEYVKSSRLM
jgi:peptide/nickel transport system substrate-binding protein